MGDMGKRIRQMRIQNNMTMEELGNALGIKASAVNKYEKGIVENIKRSTIQQMAEIFNCDPAWLMGFDNTTGESNNSVELTLEEADLVAAWKEADEETRNMIIRILAFNKSRGDN